MSIEPESLRTLAEVGAGLVGFAAVATVLSTNRNERLSVFDKIRFYWIVSSGMGVILMAYIPTWLINFVEPENDVWFYSTVVYCILGPILLLIIHSPYIFAEKGARSIIGKEEKTFSWVMNAISVLILLAVLQNLFSWPLASNQTTWEILMMIALIQIAFVFTHLVVVRGSHDAPAGLDT